MANPRIQLSLLLLITTLAAGCATSPPSNPEDVCSIFREKKGWYADARKVSEKWNSPIPTMMAIMHQESRFVHNAKPPRRKILGFIPGPRPSDAYGYPQALSGTWRDYQRSAFNYRGKRDNFADAIDFIGWYNHTSQRQSHIQPHDTYNLYLAYHEGHGGYNRRTYSNKAWLQNVSRKVSTQAERYRQQLDACESSLPRRRKFLGIF